MLRALQLLRAWYAPVLVTAMIVFGWPYMTLSMKLRAVIGYTVIFAGGYLYRRTGRRQGATS